MVGCWPLDGIVWARNPGPGLDETGQVHYSRPSPTLPCVGGFQRLLESVRQRIHANQKKEERRLLLFESSWFMAFDSNCNSISKVTCSIQVREIIFLLFLSISSFRLLYFYMCAGQYFILQAVKNAADTGRGSLVPVGALYGLLGAPSALLVGSGYIKLLAALIECPRTSRFRGPCCR